MGPSLTIHRRNDLAPQSNDSFADASMTPEDLSVQAALIFSELVLPQVDRALAAALVTQVDVQSEIPRSGPLAAIVSEYLVNASRFEKAAEEVDKMLSANRMRNIEDLWNTSLGLPDSRSLSATGNPPVTNQSLADLFTAA
jgi:hypothetical protein